MNVPVGRNSITSVLEMYGGVGKMSSRLKKIHLSLRTSRLLPGVAKKSGPALQKPFVFTNAIFNFDDFSIHSSDLDL